MTEGRIVGLHRYPVKGLSHQVLERVALEAGGAFPFDRAWAIENGRHEFDPAAPRHIPKSHFVMLTRFDRLATLQSRFDEASRTLTLVRSSAVVAEGPLDTAEGRAALEAFLAADLADKLRGPPRIVSAPGHTFFDLAAKCVHIVNLESLRDLERWTGRTLDVTRFRANILIDGVPAWSELEWEGREIAAGSARLKVFARTGRCSAPDVEPGTGIRDIQITRRIEGLHGHTDFGIYAKVAAGGTLAIGDAIG